MLLAEWQHQNLTLCHVSDIKGPLCVRNLDISLSKALMLTVLRFELNWFCWVPPFLSLLLCRGFSSSLQKYWPLCFSYFSFFSSLSFLSFLSFFGSSKAFSPSSSPRMLATMFLIFFFLFFTGFAFLFGELQNVYEIVPQSCLAYDIQNKTFQWYHNICIAHVKLEHRALINI